MKIVIPAITLAERQGGIRVLCELAGGLAEAELPEIKPTDTVLRQLPEAK